MVELIQVVVVVRVRTQVVELDIVMDLLGDILALLLHNILLHHLKAM